MDNRIYLYPIHKDKKEKEYLSQEYKSVAEFEIISSFPNNYIVI